VSQPDARSAAQDRGCDLLGCPGLREDGTCPRGYVLSCLGGAEHSAQAERMRQDSKIAATTAPESIYPHSGTCARCLRERDDLFWHAQDEEFYCADVFRCEYRYYIQGERLARGES